MVRFYPCFSTKLGRNKTIDRKHKTHTNTTRPAHNTNTTKIHKETAKSKWPPKEVEAFSLNKNHEVFVLLLDVDDSGAPNTFQPMTETKHHSFFDSFIATSPVVPGSVWYWFEIMTHGLRFGFESFPVCTWTNVITMAARIMAAALGKRYIKLLGVPLKPENSKMHQTAIQILASKSHSRY